MDWVCRQPCSVELPRDSGWGWSFDTTRKNKSHSWRHPAPKTGISRHRGVLRDSPIPFVFLLLLSAVTQRIIKPLDVLLLENQYSEQRKGIKQGWFQAGWSGLVPLVSPAAAQHCPPSPCWGWSCSLTGLTGVGVLSPSTLQAEDPKPRFTPCKPP